MREPRSIDGSYVLSRDAEDDGACGRQNGVPPENYRRPNHRYAGVSGGFGLTTVCKATSRGVRVNLVARNDTALRDADARVCAQGDHATHVVANVTKKAGPDIVVHAAIQQYGGFDTWVNNAGPGVFDCLEDISGEARRQLFEMNVGCLVYGTKIAAVFFKTKDGSIIDLRDMVSDVTFPVQDMHFAFKHVVKNFTNAFRLDPEENHAPILVAIVKQLSINTQFTSHKKTTWRRSRICFPRSMYRAAWHTQSFMPLRTVVRMMTSVATLNA